MKAGPQHWVIRIDPGSALRAIQGRAKPPQVDQPSKFVHPGDTVTWKLVGGAEKAAQYAWVVTFTDESPFDNGEKVFYPGHDTGGPVKDVSAPKICKYSVATAGGIIDPQIIPMPR